MSDSDSDDGLAPIAIRPIVCVEHHKRIAARSPMLPDHPFTLVVCGEPGSGKTHLMTALLTQENLYGAFFNQVFLVSPTVRSDPLWTALDDVPDECKIQGYSDAAFDKVIESIKETRRKHRDSIALVIIDDSMGDRQLWRQDMSSSFCQFALRYRHLNTSFVVASQALGMLPKKLRSLIQNYIFIGSHKRPTLELMLEDIDPSIGDVRRAEQLLQRGTKGDPHGFLYCHRASPAAPMEYRQGFGRKVKVLTD